MRKGTMEGIRVNKYLSESGVCSRREADRLIAEGAVTIDGQIAILGDQVLPGQRVCCRGSEVRPEEERILLALYKPKGIVCTAEKREKDNVVDFLQYPKRIYPIGRLDKNSEGLLLLTNNGDIVNRMMRAGNRHEKEYIVTVNKAVTPEFVQGMASGVYIEELSVTTRKCVVEKVAERKFRIVLTQGLNRQIRRMCEAFGYRVVRLIRVRIMNIRLGNLAVGEYREIAGGEYEALMEGLAGSSNAPAREKKRRE
ncbi:MAG: pseudouridine synthase [Roseburia sp.]|nr:pseudouridine synthase [Roseburia sp.]